MQAKTYYTAIFLFICSLGLASNEVSLRLNPTYYDEYTQSIYVTVELRYDGHGLFYLADQNYRLFYDSKLLTLNKSKSRSDLPRDLYSKIIFMEVLENLKAGSVNELAFDEQLGFVNFNIDLSDVNHGGIPIGSSEEWHRVAILNFKVHDKESLSEIIWSNADRTSKYATAFVEIMEWIGPNHTQQASVKDYIDARFNLIDDGIAGSIQVAPNPAIDFLNLSLTKELAEEITIVIHDAMGKKVLSTKMNRGSLLKKVDISELSPGSYNLEIFEKDLFISTYQTTFIKIRR